MIDTVAAGIDTMKMMRSTSITSTKGVTFMSEFWPRSNLLPPPAADFRTHTSWILPSGVRNLARPFAGPLASPKRLVKRERARLAAGGAPI
ncbi:hypothetical protein LRS10_04870 [Phenylobacterium sp. J426]|nr:hypothetical protein [Phenylobacterium sp. J426]